MITITKTEEMVKKAKKDLAKVLDKTKKFGKKAEKIADKVFWGWLCDVICLSGCQVPQGDQGGQGHGEEH